MKLTNEENALLQYALIQIMSKNNEAAAKYKKEGKLKKLKQCKSFGEKGHKLLRKLQGI